MANGTRLRILLRLACLATLPLAGVARSQAPPASFPPPTAAPPPAPDLLQTNPTRPCIQPASLVRWQDYNGKFQKVVGAFAGRLERKSVHAPRYKPGVLLCTLGVKDKFLLFVHDTLDPITFLSAAFYAGLDQAQDTAPSFGQGAAGYGHRFGAELAGEASSEFFKDFLYPTIFSEDPRYYRLGQGRVRARVFHGLTHVVVAHRENGARMFNFSEWVGTTTTVVLSNTYYPDNQRGFSPAASRVGFAVLQDMGFDLLREFWPEVARKFKLPFRGQNDTSALKNTSAP